MQFHNFLDLILKLEEKNSLFIAENFNWINSIKLPEISIDLPNIEKTSKISILNDKINPIYMQLEDGSKLFFTYDEFKRIHGNPKVGKTINITMQRLGTDNSVYPSKITMCKVID